MIFISLLTSKIDNDNFTKFKLAVKNKDKLEASKYLQLVRDIIVSGKNSRFWAYSGDKEQVETDLRILREAKQALYEYNRL